MPASHISTPIISKSKYVAGLQCSKRLWIEYNDRTLIPVADASKQRIFDQGKEVGTLAKELFPGGIEIAGIYSDFESLLKKTSDLLPLRKPLFEPAFRYRSAFVRVDILAPIEGGAWDLIEVKSSGAAKEVYLDDIAFQYVVCAGAGIPVRRCFVMHMNMAYVRSGELDIAKLFMLTDVTEEVHRRAAAIGGRLAEMQMTIAAPVAPDRRIGPHCGDPYDCPLISHCWSFVPADSVFSLYRMQEKRAFGLFDEGYLAITDLPVDYETTDRREIQIRSVRTGEVQIDRGRIEAYLDSLEYPLYFLDFETINPAIPRYDGTHPFQQIPFQFSLHVVRAPGAEPVHHSFLAEGTQDPRPELLRRLELLLGREGSIVVYNAPFERGCLNDCVKMFPDYSRWCAGVIERLSDLCRLFSDFSWYHPRQHGSASMKTVLPLLTGLSYDGMAISEGGEASEAFMRMTFGTMREEEGRKMREALVAYCGLDTRGMVAMVEQLRGSV